MSDIFYDGLLKVYKCSRIPILNGKDFTVAYDDDHYYNNSSFASPRKRKSQSITESHDSPGKRYNHQLRKIFAKVLNDMSRDDGSLIPNSIFFKKQPTSASHNLQDGDLNSFTDWKYLYDNMKVSFKQEVMRSSKEHEFIISYMMVKFPREVSVKRQIFVFVQRLEQEDGQDTQRHKKSENLEAKDQNFNTLIIVKSSVTQFTLVFLRWCENSLGSSVLIKPLKFTSIFLKHTINSLINHFFVVSGDDLAGSLAGLGDLTVEFRVKTEKNALNSIKIDFLNEDVVLLVNQIVQQNEQVKNEWVDFSHIFFNHLQENTKINFEQLPISKVMTENLMITGSEDSGGKILFYGGNNALRLTSLRNSGDRGYSQFTIYEFIFELFSLT